MHITILIACREYLCKPLKQTYPLAKTMNHLKEYLPTKHSLYSSLLCVNIQAAPTFHRPVMQYPSHIFVLI